MGRRDGQTGKLAQKGSRLLEVCDCAGGISAAAAEILLPKFAAAARPDVRHQDKPSGEQHDKTQDDFELHKSEIFLRLTDEHRFRQKQSLEKHHAFSK
jgi:hypothetical protein